MDTSYIPQKDKKILVSANITELRPDTLQIICQRLDHKQCLLSESKIYRDHRGLRQLIKLNNDDELPNSKSSPTKDVFTYMNEKKKKLNVFELLKIFEEMDRVDIIDELYKFRPGSSKPIILEDCEMATQYYNSIIISTESDNEFTEDVIRRMSKLGLNTYCYSQRLNDKVVAGTEHQVQICQLLKYDVLSILSSGRCSNVMAIFSPEFLNDGAYYFLLNDIIGYFKDKCNIIPLIWRKCNIENLQIKSLSKLAYSTSTLNNFYDTLFKTLGVPEEDVTEEDREYTLEAHIVKPFTGEVINVHRTIDDEQEHGFRKYVRRCTFYFRNMPRNKNVF